MVSTLRGVACGPGKGLLSWDASGWNGSFTLIRSPVLSGGSTIHGALAEVDTA